jgi:hypothetical protein
VARPHVAGIFLGDEGMLAGVAPAAYCAVAAAAKV